MTDIPDSAADSDILDQVRDAARQLVADLSAPDGQPQPLDYPAVTAALQKCLDQLAATGLWGSANRLPSSELWRIAGQLLEVGSLQHRARFKPRGYAGDWQMLQQICENWCCDHPLGRHFDRFFQEQAAPQAVRNRTDLIAAAIRQQAIAKPGSRIVLVGSGPAIDLRQALEGLLPDQRRDLSATLLDLDPEALQYATESLSGLLETNRLSCRRENLYRLPKNKSIAQAMAGADLLVCSGLMDYLDETDATAMLQLFRQSLTDGGRMLVFNFAPNNPSRSYMEWIGNWYLIYRDCRQMHELAQAAGFAEGQFTLKAEPLGTNLYIDAIK